MYILSVTETSSVGKFGENFLQFLATLFIFVLVLLVAYFVTRWIGTVGQGQLGNKNIRVIEGYKIGPNKSIQIVKVGNKLFVLGIGKDEISCLGEVEEEDLAITEDTISPLPDFKELLAKAKEKVPTKKNNK